MRDLSPDAEPVRRGQVPQRGDALPARTSRTKRAGRHRSPHRLTVPLDAPSLVLAVPGAAPPAAADVASQIAATASQSCPGVDIRVGYLSGGTQTLAGALTFGPPRPGQPEPRAVIVPLLAAPHPVLDAAIAEAAGRADGPVLLASHLGPHPLLAEALHARLADAGLARQDRARGLNIVTGTNGVLVLADGGEEAVQAAGVAAVLLAARLAIPAVPASLGDPGTIAATLGRLRDAGVSRPAIAPCIIGPETPAQEMDALRALAGVPVAPPLGAHTAVGQLVAIRYGAALAGVAMAGSAG